ncbi:Uncharacterized protein HZ326_0926 [Fusarium oxysporum f. sp. albedinis]|nr:Uncharacterized protein HZ326_0926 [Fusarium oxysporum f. sp. albedinis]
MLHIVPDIVNASVSLSLRLKPRNTVPGPSPPLTLHQSDLCITQQETHEIKRRSPPSESRMIRRGGSLTWKLTVSSSVSGAPDTEETGRFKSLNSATTTTTEI